MYTTAEREREELSLELTSLRLQLQKEKQAAAKANATRREMETLLKTSLEEAQAKVARASGVSAFVHRRVINFCVLCIHPLTCLCNNSALVDSAGTQFHAQGASFGDAVADRLL